MGRARYDNRRDWRRRSGTKPDRAQRSAGVPTRLILVIVAAIAGSITQYVLQHSASLQNTVSNWTEPLPDPLVGRVSVIDGDTVEIAGKRIRFNGIDAPESRQYCDDAKGFEYPCGRRAAQALEEFLAAPGRCAAASSIAIDTAALLEIVSVPMAAMSRHGS